MVEKEEYDSECINTYIEKLGYAPAQNDIFYYLILEKYKKVKGYGKK